MKQIILTLVAALAVCGASAQTNTVKAKASTPLVASSATSTNFAETAKALTNAVSEAKDYGVIEITLGSSGVSTKGGSSFGLDFSVSSNPFESLPQLWLGVAQGVAWEPSFSGSTDVFADWNTHIYKNWYLQTGWSVGMVYDRETAYWRTGPEVTVQYYFQDKAYLYGGVNYDINQKQNRESDGFRFSFGIGVDFDSFGSIFHR